MKKSIFFFAILLQIASSIVSTAQTIRFTDTTNRWKTSTTIYPDDEPITSTDIYEASDSLREWNGQLYTEITKDGAPVLYVREDTTTRKVYVAPILNQVGHYTISDHTAEFTYMDFSLDVGDTLTFPLRLSIPDSPADTISKYYVREIDSLQFGANWHKRMWMERISGIGHFTGDNYYVIEGIGFGLSFGVTSPLILTQGTAEWPPQVICFSNKGIIPNPPFHNTCFDPVGIQESHVDSNHFMVYPNPAKNNVCVQLPLDTKDAFVELMDLSGRILQRQLVKNKSAYFQLENFSKGLYILKISGVDMKPVYRKLKIH